MQVKVDNILNTIGRIVLGKEEQIRLSFACLLAKGHLLLEDLPGMGKTTLSQAFAYTFGLSYQRIQFTSDLLPGDILGASIYQTNTGSFTFHEGPIFTELLLADEINRATPKSQSALLEAMEERQVSIEGQTRRLPDHFFVIATQNPMSSSGTFPLPDSQLDRFLMKVSLGYPAKAAEFALLKGENPRQQLKQLSALITASELTAMQQAVEKIFVADDVLHYILRLVEATRANDQFALGLSPRGSLALLSASKAWAFLEGRDYVIPDDVKMVLAPVCTHRIRDAKNLSGQDNHHLIHWLLNEVPAL